MPIFARSLGCRGWFSPPATPPTSRAAAFGSRTPGLIRLSGLILEVTSMRRSVLSLIVGARASSPVLVSVFLLVLALPTAGQKHPFTFEDMMALKRVEEPVPSPDGKWVLFAAVDVDLKANTKTPHVWVVPLRAKAGSSATADETRSANHPASVGMTGSGGG